MRRFRLHAGVATLLISRVVWGQHGSVREQADRLFDEGRSLLNQGATNEACAHFARSHKLLPRPGTELNLAVCLEQQGDNVAAVRHFRRALKSAEAAGRRDRQELAQEHLEGLQSKLAWLEVHRETDATGSSVILLVDGEPVTEAEDEPVPLEPGVHAIDVQAAGRVIFRLQLPTVAGTSYVVTAHDVKFDGAPASPVQESNASAPKIGKAISPSASKERSHAAWSKQAHPVWGIALVGTGTVAAVVGSAFGIRAVNIGDEINESCPNLVCRTEEALTRSKQLNADGKTAALVANIALPVGALLGAVGVYFLASRASAGTDTTSSSRTKGGAPVFELHAQARRRAASAVVRTMW